MNEKFELIAPRRAFLAGMAALGASAVLPGCQTMEGAGGGKPYRIDVHHHFAPPDYSAALKAKMRGHAKWSVAGTIEEMDKSGTATCFTSLINPGMQAWMGDVEGSKNIPRKVPVRTSTRKQNSATSPSRNESSAGNALPRNARPVSRSNRVSTQS